MSVTATYSTNTRALRRWSAERLALRDVENSKIHAQFRFEGSTCSNMGRPLAFLYSVTLSSREEGHRILEMDCVPAPEDEGHRSMCSYLESAERILGALLKEKPLLGEPLEAVLAWQPKTLPAGCMCSQSSRDHKWLLVLQTIHFALEQKNSTPNPS